MQPSNSPDIQCQSQTVIDQDGLLQLFPEFISPPESAQLFEELLNTLAWQNESIRMFGKQIPVPRLVCWYGDENARYTYSGVSHQPLPWTESLLAIRRRIENQTGALFNSVLGNLYRNERDSMGWHADNEYELGLNPVIASLSLGQSRTFKLRHNKSRNIVDLELASGSLAVMSGQFQHCWQHSLPKWRSAKSQRINLTYRHIHNT